MTGDELKQALLNEKPVLLSQTDGQESEYACVSAIVYRKQGDKISVTAELLDKNKNSVNYCDPKRVRYK